MTSGTVQHPTFWILGAGRVGCNFARWFSGHGASVQLWNPVTLDRGAKLALQGEEDISVTVGEPLVDKPPPDLVFLAVPDAHVEENLGRLDDWGLAHSIPALHTSGSRQIDTSGLSRSVGCAHPATAFSSHALASDAMKQVVFLLEGATDATETARRILESTGLRCVSAQKVDKLAYHAGCVFASNFAALSGVLASETFGHAGLTREQSTLLLGSLMQSATDSLGSGSTPDALTGPAVRGDEATVRSEYLRLRESDPNLARHYLHGTQLIALMSGQWGIVRLVERLMVD